MNALGIIAFVVALLISVMIHEGGHFLTARAFGMKATQFFVGFGPTLFSRRHGETEYGVKAIPAGGFVKIIGMTPLEEVDPADAKRAFFRQPTPQRVVVLAAGSLMHFVIAIVLAVGVAFLVPVAKPGSGIGAVSNCVPVTLAAGAAAADPKGACTGNFVDGPARLAGLKAGDVVTAIDGRSVSDDAAASRLIRNASQRSVTVTVRRGSQTLELPVTLAPVKRDAAKGGPGADDTFAIGIAFGGDTGYAAPSLSQGAHQARQYLTFNSQSVLFGTFYALGNIGSEAGDLFNPHRAQEAANGGAQLSSVVGVAKISGDIFAAEGVPTSVRIGDFLLIVGAVNASVGILNLLPLLPFDGGHIAVTLAERWTRRRRRMPVGRAGPRPDGAAGLGKAQAVRLGDSEPVRLGEAQSVRLEQTGAFRLEETSSVGLDEAAEDAEVGQRIGRFYTRGAPVMYAFSLVIIVFSLVVLVADVQNPAT